jgi:hypothetical protein
MPFLCGTGGNRRRWTSRTESDVPGSPRVNDGKIRVNRENPNTGVFSGEHSDKTDAVKTPVSGVCGRGSGAACSEASCHIEIDRTIREGRQTYNMHYEAEFVRDGNFFLTQGGRYSKRLVGRERVKKPDRTQGEDDGTWIGEKPLT